MDLENLQDKKYAELLKLATRLQLQLPQSKKKDVLIQIIKEHYESNSNVENEITSPKKRVKKTRKAKKKQPDCLNELETDKSKKMTRSALASINQTLPKNEEPSGPENKEPLEPCTTKKSKKKEKIQDQEVIETRYETREDGKRVKIKRIKKKVNKEVNNDEKEQKKTKKVKKTKKNSPTSPIVDEKNESVNENVSHDQNKESISFKLELNESDKMASEMSPREHLVETNQPNEVGLNELIKTKENNQVADSSLITNDEDKTDNELEPELTRDIINTTFESKKEPCPLMSKQDGNLDTDKPDNIQTNEPCEVTSKLGENLVSDKLDKVQVPENVNLNEPCQVTFKQDDHLVLPKADNVQEPENIQKEPKPTATNLEEKTEKTPRPNVGRARIVRPKQVVTTLQSVKTANNDTIVAEVKKLVEVVNREAGPRIVKPAVVLENTSLDPKRKNPNDPDSKFKKIKDVDQKKKENEPFKLVARKVPDFKAIHEKESQKLESIDTYVNRKQEKLSKLAENSSSFEDKVKTKTSTLSVGPQSVPNKKTPLKTGTTPKFVKNLASQTGSLLSTIHKVIKRDENKIEQSGKFDPNSDEPKTPVISEQEKRSKFAKTPSSVTKPTESSLLKSNIKRASSVKLNLNDTNSHGSIPVQLQSSSFVRRKSFDLNKSLARTLNYNPHHGKLKKVDFSAKSIFLSSLATNLNESKICDNKSVLKSNNSTLNANDANRRIVTTINKLRTDNNNVCLDHKMVTDYLKSDKVKQITDKSTLMAKKLRLEKTKLHKQTRSDENRQINVNNCQENEQAL